MFHHYFDTVLAAEIAMRASYKALILGGILSNYHNTYQYFEEFLRISHEIEKNDA